MRARVAKARGRLMITGIGAVAALALLGACGSDGDGPGVATVGGAGPTPSASTSAAGDRTEQLRQFAQCMRDNGVDMADPDLSGAGLGLPAGVNLADPAVASAVTACQSKLPNGGAPPKLDADQLERYQTFATCMREHGIELPDPGPDGTLQLGQGGPGQFLSDPGFQPALTACRDALGGLRGATPTGAAS